MPVELLKRNWAVQNGWATSHAMLCTLTQEEVLRWGSLPVKCAELESERKSSAKNSKQPLPGEALLAFPPGEASSVEVEPSGLQIPREPELSRMGSERRPSPSNWLSARLSARSHGEQDKPRRERTATVCQLKRTQTPGCGIFPKQRSATAPGRGAQRHVLPASWWFLRASRMFNFQSTWAETRACAFS